MRENATGHFDNLWFTMTSLYDKWDEGEMTGEIAVARARAAAKEFLKATEPEGDEPEEDYGPDRPLKDSEVVDPCEHCGAPVFKTDGTGLVRDYEAQMPHECGVTGQYFDSRVVRGSRAYEAAEDFVRLAGEQVGKEFPLNGSTTDATILLDQWPDDEAFGDWFTEWAERWHLTVED